MKSIRPPRTATHPRTANARGSTAHSFATTSHTQRVATALTITGATIAGKMSPMATSANHATARLAA